MPTLTPEQLVATLDPDGIKCDDAHRYALALGLFDREVTLDAWRRLWRSAHVTPTPAAAEADDADDLILQDDPTSE